MFLIHVPLTTYKNVSLKTGIRCRLMDLTDTRWNLRVYFPPCFTPCLVKVAVDIVLWISFLLSQRVAVKCSTWFAGCSHGLFIFISNPFFFWSFHFLIFFKPLGQYSFGFLGWLEHFIWTCSHQNPSVSTERHVSIIIQLNLQFPCLRLLCR